MRPTFHLIPEPVWRNLDRSTPYAAGSLATEGFVHCTDGMDQLIATANRHYRTDPRPFMVLTLDLDAVGSPWTVDDVGRIYPHIHGPVAPAAILGVAALRRSDDGSFIGFAPDVDRDALPGG